MDENEKMVLRRRRNDIAEQLEITRDLLKELSTRGLISHDAMKEIEREKTAIAKAERVIDSMLFLNHADGFSTFCALLHQNAGGSYSSRLANELQADLRLERGEVKPRQEIFDEAASLVHRKFGPSKRFSEADKREVADLIAVKLQLTKDDWTRETEKIRQELEQLREELRNRDERSCVLCDLLKDFLRKHERQLTTYSHDMTTTSDLLREMMEDMQPDEQMANGNMIHTLERNLKIFFRQVETMLNHREALYYEKEKCLRLLEVPEADHGVQLDDLIGRLTGLSVKADMSVESKDGIIARLRRQVENLEKECEQQDRQLTAYQNEMADKEREIAELRRKVQIL